MICIFGWARVFYKALSSGETAFYNTLNNPDDSVAKSAIGGLLGISVGDTDIAALRNDYLRYLKNKFETPSHGLDVIEDVIIIISNCASNCPTNSQLVPPGHLGLKAEEYREVQNFLVRVCLRNVASGDDGIRNAVESVSVQMAAILYDAKNVTCVH